MLAIRQMLKTWEIVQVLVVLVVLVIIRFVQTNLGVGDDWLISKQSALAIMAASWAVYLLGCVLRSTSEAANQVLEQHKEHRGPTTGSAAPASAHPSQPLRYQNMLAGLFSSEDTQLSYLRDPCRQTGKSWLIPYIMERMSFHHLILVSDLTDQQTAVRALLDRIGGLETSTMRVISTDRVSIIKGTTAYHIILASVDPTRLKGLVFETVELSATFRGRTPDWWDKVRADNDLRLKGMLCSYPRCSCPADHPGTPNWCLRNLPTESA